MADDGRPKLVALAPKRETPATWNPVDACKEFLADVESGKIVPLNVMIFWIEEGKAGRRVPRYWHANVSTLEQIGYGELLKTLAMESWRET